MNTHTAHAASGNLPGLYQARCTCGWRGTVIGGEPEAAEEAIAHTAFAAINARVDAEREAGYAATGDVIRAEYAAERAARNFRCHAHGLLPEPGCAACAAAISTQHHTADEQRAYEEEQTMLANADPHTADNAANISVRVEDAYGGEAARTFVTISWENTKYGGYDFISTSYRGVIPHATAVERAVADFHATEVDEDEDAAFAPSRANDGEGRYHG